MKRVQKDRGRNNRAGGGRHVGDFELLRIRPSSLETGARCTVLELHTGGGKRGGGMRGQKGTPEEALAPERGAEPGKRVLSREHPEVRRLAR